MNFVHTDCIDNQMGKYDKGKEVVSKVAQAMSTMRSDFVVNNLRKQISRLCSIVDNIERASGVDYGCTEEALKTIEASLRQIRRLCMEG